MKFQPTYIHSHFLKKKDGTHSAPMQRYYIERVVDKNGGFVPIWLGTLKIGMQYPVEKISRERSSKEVYWSRRLPKAAGPKEFARLERERYWNKFNKSC